ncbi:phosphatase PAP2 family protein [Paenibacillus woosongensis]|uniref:Phosphatase PAP2 family protein n=1 Tax=Paenibacillus woosongensis TaxID=307580 RepID=A0AA95IBM3_9BACL|nr:phosphatase PAP2 family protein [Paenibacillus woosongensis]WHX51004.1 phosphatase PAP2 family protein [Paenibacillus woosongensis]
MRYSHRQRRVSPYVIFWALLALAGFGVIAFFAVRQPLNSFDLHVAAWVQSFESASLTRIMVFFSTLGSTKFTILITLSAMLILFFVLQHRMELLFLAAFLGGASLLNKLLKIIFQRERPFVHRLVEETGFSFPSGHAMAAFALYGALAFLLWRHIRPQWGRILLIVLSCFMVVMICISRIYLGVHYPSDIAGALLASGFWLSVMIGIAQWYEGRYGAVSEFRLRR